MASNQGRVLDGVLEDVEVVDLQKATVALRKEIGRHPVDSSCDCPTLEALAVLYELGYRVVKSPRNGVMDSPRRDGEMRD